MAAELGRERRPKRQFPLGFLNTASSLMLSKGEFEERDQDVCRESNPMERREGGGEGAARSGGGEWATEPDRTARKPIY